MKIAIFSDIHGNKEALLSAIEDAKTQNVDTYVVTGDITGDFPFSNEVVEIIKELPCNVIKGNREQYLVEYEENPMQEKWKTLQSKQIVYTYKQLTKENRKYLIELEETKTVNYHDFSIKLVHGSPNKINERVFWREQEKLENLANNLQEDVLIFGHTHEPPNYQQIGNKLIISAGTLGIPYYTQNLQYFILEHKENTKENVIQKREVSYNKEKLKEEIIKSGALKIVPTWINLSYATILNGKEDVNALFIREGLDRMQEKKKSNGMWQPWNNIDDDIWLQLHKEYGAKYQFIK